MMPHTEPNALPAVYDSWTEWRASYLMYVMDFTQSHQGDSDKLFLKIRLKRLGFAGRNLDDELTYIQEQAYVPAAAC